MTVLLDTSALYAVFDRDDINHQAAGRRWKVLLDTDARLITHNYVVLELTALLQHRLGMEAVRDLVVEILPVCTVQWVSDDDVLVQDSSSWGSPVGDSLFSCSRLWWGSRGWGRTRLLPTKLVSATEAHISQAFLPIDPDHGEGHEYADEKVTCRNSKCRALDHEMDDEPTL